MIKKLNNNQRKFLEYILRNHYGLGWSGTISNILHDGEYSTRNGDIQVILNRFEDLKNPTSKLRTTFSIPTKYLKG